MSTELEAINAREDLKEIAVTRFWGGSENGSCLQLTQEYRVETSPMSRLYGYIMVDKAQALELIERLEEFIHNY